MTWEELENRTLWDIEANGSSLQLLWVSAGCFVLAVMYSIIGIYYWVKFKIRRG